jgi:hypothetical protein
MKVLESKSQEKALAKKEIAALARFKNLMKKNAGKLSFEGLPRLT